MRVLLAILMVLGLAWLLVVAVLDLVRTEIDRWRPLQFKGRKKLRDTWESKKT